MGRTSTVVEETEDEAGMRTGVALTVLALLAATGCASADPGPAAAEPAAVESAQTGPCDIRESVPVCTEKLTKVVLAGLAAFDDLEDPTVEEVEADTALSRGSEAWAANCRQWETYMVGDVVLVDGCQDALDRIVSGAAALGVPG